MHRRMHNLQIIAVGVTNMCVQQKVRFIAFLDSLDARTRVFLLFLTFQQ